MSRVAFVTCDAWSNLTDDDRLAVALLAERGVAVTPAVWSDPRVAWRDYDAVILRSTWDYHLRATEFRAWLDALERDGVRVWNSVGLARWNMTKTYLRDLERRGVPIVPTVWLAAAEPLDLAARLDASGWREAVLKPVVSATAFETWTFDAPGATALETRVAAAAPVGRMMQPLLGEVRDEGEWSLMWFGGSYSHATLKRPRPGDFRVQTDFGGSAAPATAPPELIASARRVLDAIDGPWLYARVDGVRSGGAFLLMELELIEPALFLGLGEGAPQRFADAVVAAVR